MASTESGSMRRSELPGVSTLASSEGSSPINGRSDPPRPPEAVTSTATAHNTAAASIAGFSYRPKAFLGPRIRRCPGAGVVICLVESSQRTCHRALCEGFGTLEAIVVDGARCEDIGHCHHRFRYVCLPRPYEPANGKIRFTPVGRR